MIDDPKTIKALTHPARLVAIEELFAGRELTATEAAHLAGVSASAMSYHLRALERAGLIERAAHGGDGRERPWRARGERMAVNSGGSAASLAATATLARSVVDRLRTELSQWLARSRDEDPVWREVSGVASARLWLTAEEAAEVDKVISALVDRFRGRGPGSTPGARPMHLAVLLFPSDDGSGGQKSRESAP